MGEQCGMRLQKQTNNCADDLKIRRRLHVAHTEEAENSSEGVKIQSCSGPKPPAPVSSLHPHSETKRSELQEQNTKC